MPIGTRGCKRAAAAALCTSALASALGWTPAHAGDGYAATYDVRIPSLEPGQDYQRWVLDFGVEGAEGSDSLPVSLELVIDPAEAALLGHGSAMVDVIRCIGQTCEFANYGLSNPPEEPFLAANWSRATFVVSRVNPDEQHYLFRFTDRLGGSIATPFQMQIFAGPDTYSLNQPLGSFDTTFELDGTVTFGSAQGIAVAESPAPADCAAALATIAAALHVRRRASGSGRDLSGSADRPSARRSGRRGCGGSRCR